MSNEKLTVGQIHQLTIKNNPEIERLHKLIEEYSFKYSEALGAQSELTALRNQVAELQRQLDEAAKQEPVFCVNEADLTAIPQYKGVCQITAFTYQSVRKVPLYRHPPNLPAMIEHAVKEEYNKLSPSAWTRAMSDAWHRAIPDLQAAFDALISEAIRARRGE